MLLLLFVLCCCCFFGGVFGLFFVALFACFAFVSAELQAALDSNTLCQLVTLTLAKGHNNSGRQNL